MRGISECGSLLPFIPALAFPPAAAYHRPPMSDVTQLLNAIEAGEPKAADQLLPLVYEELRKLAAVKMAQEKPGQTLQATALRGDIGPIDRSNLQKPHF